LKKHENRLLKSEDSDAPFWQHWKLMDALGYDIVWQKRQ